MNWHVSCWATFVILSMGASWALKLVIYHVKLYLPHTLASHNLGVTWPRSPPRVALCFTEYQYQYQQERFHCNRPKNGPHPAGSIKVGLSPGLV